MKTEKQYPELQPLLNLFSDRLSKKLHAKVRVSFVFVDEVSTIDRIKNAVVKVTGISWESIISKRRFPEISMAKQLFCWFCRRYTSVSLKDLATMLGGRHHTSVIHSCQYMQNMIDVQDDTAMVYYRKIKKMIQRHEA